MTKPESRVVVLARYFRAVEAAREQAARRMWFLGSSLYWASLSNTPNCRKLMARMTDPRPGDLVMANDIRRGDEHNAVGIYLRFEDRPDLDEDGKQYATTRHWLIERLGKPGDEYAWHNIQLLAIPDGERWPVSDWTGGVMTGDSLLAVLRGFGGELTDPDT